MWIFPWASDTQYDTVMMLDGGGEPQVAAGPGITGVNHQRSAAYYRQCLSDALFSHPIMGTKHPSEPLASGKKRKATTLAKTLTIAAQPWADARVLSTLKVGKTKL